MHIREATLKDFESVSKLQHQVHTFHVKERPDIYRDSMMEFSYFESLIDDENTQVFLIEQNNGEIIAYTTVRLIETTHAPHKVQRKIMVMDAICVDTRYRKRGVGKLLFDTSIEYAKEKEASSLELSVFDFNDSAITFYESLGMKTQSRKMEMNLENECID